MAGIRMDIPYVRPSLPRFAELASDLEQIISSGRLTKGETVRQYEEALSKRLAVKNVVATSSCTIGLTLLYRALDINGPVIVPSFTFMATVNALIWAGGTPTFVDVDPLTWTLDVAGVEQALSSEIQAIVGVPVFGSPCDNAGLESIAASSATPLLFDSAHGVGSSYRGVPLGGFGRAEVFSTTPTKTLVTGEGGFVATNDDELANELRILIEYGNDGAFDTRSPGLNGRLPEISALIGLRMLDILDELLERRAHIVASYTKGLEDIDGLALQHVREECVSSFKDYTITIDEQSGNSRDRLATDLAAMGVQTKRYFSPVVHRQGPYRSLGYDGKLPVTERLERQALSLPIWSGMKDDEIAYVIDAVRSALALGSQRSSAGNARSNS